VPHDLVMPRLGMTMTEGVVTHWLKQPGQAVDKGEVLLIIETDKVEIEIESPCSGIFNEVLVELGQAVPVGTVIGRIVQPGETTEKLGTTLATTVPVSAPEQRVLSTLSGTSAVLAPRPQAPEGVASPRAKKLARELNVDILRVPDYEGRGRISESDVRRFFDERSSSGTRAQVAPAAVSDPSGGDTQASSTVRKIIADKMTLSFQTIPHFYLTVLADATDLVKLRREMILERAVEERLSYTDFLLKALAVSVRSHPIVNAYWQDATGTAPRRNEVNVGIAVQTPNRLFVPVIRNAADLPFLELAKVRASLVKRARSGKLRVDDVGDASCTLSNLGSYEVDHFQAIINPPESVTLASGRIASRPMVVEGAVVPRETLYLSLSADHRIIDGAAGAAFLDTILQLIQSPGTLLGS
jgi:pyruvate dehydrogenase E2 component (dihydrolipoamide acetyltransferase)